MLRWGRCALGRLPDPGAGLIKAHLPSPSGPVCPGPARLESLGTEEWQDTGAPLTLEGQACWGEGLCFTKSFGQIGARTQTQSAACRVTLGLSRRAGKAFPAYIGSSIIHLALADSLQYLRLAGASHYSTRLKDMLPTRPCPLGAFIPGHTPPSTDRGDSLVTTGFEAEADRPTPARLVPASSLGLCWGSSEPAAPGFRVCLGSFKVWLNCMSENSN